MLVLPYLAILPHWPFPIHLEESRYFLLGGGTPPPNDSKEGKRTRSRGKLAKPYETFMLLHAENQNKKVCRPSTKKKIPKVPKISLLSGDYSVQFN